MIDLVPFILVSWMKILQGKRTGNHSPSLFDPAQDLFSDGLDHDIADRSGLHRTCDHGEPRSISRELIEKLAVN